MSRIDAAWLEHQQRRWRRHDAHRWLRPDYQRYQASQPDERKYSPGQPRVPAGHPGGGQWTKIKITVDYRHVGICKTRIGTSA